MGIFRRPGGELLSGRPERSQWPRPPSLGPAGQFTLRSAKGWAQSAETAAPPLPPCRPSPTVLKKSSGIGWGRSKGLPPIHWDRAARCAAPTADTEAVPSFVGAGHWPARGRGLPLPYRSPESPSSMGRECPWASRQDAPQKMAGGHMGPPLRVKQNIPGRADEGKTGVYVGTLIIPEAFPSSGPFGTTFPQGKA